MCLRVRGLNATGEGVRAKCYMNQALRFARCFHGQADRRQMREVDFLVVVGKTVPIRLRWDFVPKSRLTCGDRAGLAVAGCMKLDINRLLLPPAARVSVSPCYDRCFVAVLQSGPRDARSSILPMIFGRSFGITSPAKIRPSRLRRRCCAPAINNLFYSRSRSGKAKSPPEKQGYSWNRREKSGGR